MERGGGQGRSSTAAAAAARLGGERHGGGVRVLVCMRGYHHRHPLRTRARVNAASSGGGGRSTARGGGVPSLDPPAGHTQQAPTHSRPRPPLPIAASPRTSGIPTPRLTRQAGWSISSIALQGGWVGGWVAPSCGQPPARQAGLLGFWRHPPTQRHARYALPSTPLPPHPGAASPVRDDAPLVQRQRRDAVQRDPHLAAQRAVVPALPERLPVLLGGGNHDLNAQVGRGMWTLATPPRWLAGHTPSPTPTRCGGGGCCCQLLLLLGLPCLRSHRASAPAWDAGCRAPPRAQPVSGRGGAGGQRGRVRRGKQGWLVPASQRLPPLGGGAASRTPRCLPAAVPPVHA